MRRRLFAALAGLAVSVSLTVRPACAQGYYGGSLKIHGHTKAAGDGGQLTDPQFLSGAEVSSGPLVLDGAGGGSITFGDGTTQNTQAILPAGANVMSGTFTYTAVSSVTFNGPVSASSVTATAATVTTFQATTLSLNGSPTYGYWVPFASGTFTNVSTVTVLGLASSTTYHCEFDEILSGTLSQPDLVFNQAGQSTATVTTYYSMSGNAAFSATTPAISDQGDQCVTLGDPTATGNFTAAFPYYSYAFDFSTVYGTSTTLRGFAHAVTANSTTNPVSSYSSFTSKPLPGAGITDFEIFFGAANCGVINATTKRSGKFYCYKRQEP